MVRQPTIVAVEHAYTLPLDRSGQAHRRRRGVGRSTAATATATATTVQSADIVQPDSPQLPQPAVPVPAPPAVPVPAAFESLPKTTKWRHEKKLKEAIARGEPAPPPKKKPRKEYSCRVCGATGHPQYYGARYCPQDAKVSYEEWLAQQKARRIKPKDK